MFYLMLTEQFKNNDSKAFCRCFWIGKVQGFWLFFEKTLHFVFRFHSEIEICVCIKECLNQEKSEISDFSWFVRRKPFEQIKFLICSVDIIYVIEKEIIIKLFCKEYEGIFMDHVLFLKSKVCLKSILFFLKMLS